MQKIKLDVFNVMTVLLMTVFVIPYCFAEGSEDDMNRYQIFPVQTFSVLLDTKTGKIWKINTDMTGKMKAEGVSVEGLAYANTEVDTLNNKIKDIDFDSVPEKHKKECKEKIFTDFSYVNMDNGKINNILRSYREISR
jgi:hypothetical protein